MNSLVDQIRQRQIVEIFRVEEDVEKVGEQNWNDCKKDDDSNKPSRKAAQFRK